MCRYKGGIDAELRALSMLGMLSIQIMHAFAKLCKHQNMFEIIFVLYIYVVHESIVQ